MGKQGQPETIGSLLRENSFKHDSPSTSSSETRAAAKRELEARVLAIRRLFARYPNAKLDTPELTLEVYIADTRFLPLDELERAIEAAVRASPRFVPTAGELLNAYVEDGVELIERGYGPLSIDQVKSDLRFKRRKHLRQLRESHTAGLLGTGDPTPQPKRIRG